VCASPAAARGLLRRGRRGDLAQDFASWRTPTRRLNFGREEWVFVIRFPSPPRRDGLSYCAARSGTGPVRPRGLLAAQADGIGPTFTKDPHKQRQLVWGTRRLAPRPTPRCVSRRKVGPGEPGGTGRVTHYPLFVLLTLHF
jgi:hypothetical protein